MKVISRTTQVALDILQLLHHEPTRWVSIATLAEAIGRTKSYTAPVVGRLAQAGLIITSGQGCRINPDAARLSAAQFISLFHKSTFVQNPLRGDLGASNRLVGKIEAILHLTPLDELIA
jgi:DNA-binding IscR family transcriptional regulator